MALSRKPLRARVRPSLFLGLAWLVLGVWVVFGFFFRRESLQDDDLALPTLAFFMISAVIGSRVWLFVHNHREHAHEPRTLP